MQPMAALDVGVLEDDAGALAAELEQRALHGARRLLADLHAHLGRSGEADAVHVVGIHQCGGGGRTVAVDEVDHPGREADVVEDADELHDGERVLRRRLHDDGVAGRQRRRHLAGHVDHREVVGGDAGHHAERLAVDHAADDPAGRQRRRLRGLGEQRRLQHAAGVAGVALEAVGRHGHLHARADGRGRPGLGDHERQQLRGLGPDGRGGLAHEGAALLGRPGRPARLGLLGRSCGGQGVVRAGVGRRARRSPRWRG